MKLKCCGMKYKDNIEAIASLQPDYLGFIFYDKSPRHFDIEIPDLPASIKKTGVFVDEDLDTIIQLAKRHQLQALQLHGKETSEYCEQLKLALPDIELIKVFSIKDNFNFEVLQPYEAIVDYYLFDTKGKYPGGNGYTFNWDILKNYPSKKPFFLSGGIGLEDLEKIKAFQQNPVSKYCYALDVNSKFEIKAGLKNVEALKEFKNKMNELS